MFLNFQKILDIEFCDLKYMIFVDDKYFILEI